jgi:hypothetical protein
MSEENVELHEEVREIIGTIGRCRFLPSWEATLEAAGVSE